jgi:hypothetical protein
MMPSLWSLLLQQKNLAKKGKVIQTSTLPKFALYKYNVDKYTINIKTITSQREALLGIAVDGCICGDVFRASPEKHPHSLFITTENPKEPTGNDSYDGTTCYLTQIHI